MAYIRDNDDWRHANGDYRSRSELHHDMRVELEVDKHLPDWRRDEIRQELRNDRDWREGEAEP